MADDGGAGAGAGLDVRVDARLVYRFDAPAEVLLLLEAARSPDQQVLAERLILTPAADVSRADDLATGDRRAIFTAAGEVEIAYEADVRIGPRLPCLAELPATPIRQLPTDTLRYLLPSRFCPADLFETFVRRQFAGLEGGRAVAAILAWIGEALTYQPGASDAHTTAADTFVSRAGVCRDFTHLAIALCRAADIPARAVSAYAWTLEPPDMHAVLEVYLGGRWRMADPTGLAPVAGLVRVATGLDAAEIAFMTIFGRAELVTQSFAVTSLTRRHAPAATDA